MLGYYKNTKNDNYEIIINNDYEPDYSVVLDYFGESEKLANMNDFDELTEQEQDELVTYCDSKTDWGSGEYFGFIIEKTENGKRENIAESWSIPTIKDLIVTMSKALWEVNHNLNLQDFFPTHDLSLLIIDYYKGEFRKFNKLLGVDYENKQAKIYNTKGEVESTINIYDHAQRFLDYLLADELEKVKQKYESKGE